MAWLRLDDGFTKHPKFEGWPPAQRWAWLETMEYCARYRTGGRIPADLSLLPRAVTRTLLERAKASGWVDVDEAGGLWIHGWDEFNPTRIDDLEGAVERALAEHPTASANELVRITGGNRKQALELIRQFRAGSGNGSPAPVPPVVPHRLRARIPSRPQELEPAAAAGTTPETPAAAAENPENPDQPDDLEQRLAAIGLHLEPEHFARPELVAAWLDLAAEEARDNPAGYVLAGVRSGALPSPRARANAPEPDLLEPPERRRRFVETSGWRFAAEDLAEELEELGASPDELVVLVDLAADLRRAHVGAA